MPASAMSDETWIRTVVERFYDRVRTDALLAPVFAEGVSDWDDHHRRLVDFWSSVMLGTGRYKGNPVALHMRHAKSMTPAHLERWLDLWRETGAEVLPPRAATALQAKAERIAESLTLAIRYRRPAAA